MAQRIEDYGLIGDCDVLVLGDAQAPAGVEQRIAEAVGAADPLVPVERCDEGGDSLFAGEGDEVVACGLGVGRLLAGDRGLAPAVDQQEAGRQGACRDDEHGQRPDPWLQAHCANPYGVTERR